MRFDITALGEILIDFVQLPTTETGSLQLEGNSGGAPANVLACATALGRKTAMIGSVGADGFGRYLKAAIREAGVNTDAVTETATAPTTLAMVTLDNQGDRSFHFYRNQTADVMLTDHARILDTVRQGRVFHFGSVSMTTEPARSATFQAAAAAKACGIRLSFDPNLRVPLWSDLSDAKACIQRGLDLADFVKLSEEELWFLTGAERLEQGMERLMQGRDMQLLVVTRGAAGCICRYQGEWMTARAYDVASMDTTGAGDAFWGTVLAGLTALPTADFSCSPEELRRILKRANAAGSLATTKKGAIPALPNDAEIERCIALIPEIYP